MSNVSGTLAYNEGSMNISEVSGREHKHRSTLTLVREMVAEISLERLRGVGKYATRHVVDPDDVLANRLFATERFACLGKIDLEAIDPETGLLRYDHFHDIGAVRYVTTMYDGQVVSVGKLIWAEGIPMQQLRTPFDDVERQNPELYERLASLPDGSVGELGSLAKTPGVSQVAILSTLSEIYRQAEDNGLHYMVAGLEPAAWPRYRALFGSGIELMGDEPLQYPGIIGDQVGICMDIRRAYQHYRDDFRRDSVPLRLQRLLVSELYANRVGSFQSCLGRYALRKLP